MFGFAGQKDDEDGLRLGFVSDEPEISRRL
jgi:hypothetical protein